MSRLLALACAALAVGELKAEDLPTPSQQLQQELGRALAAADEKGAVALLAEVGALYRHPLFEQESPALLQQTAAALKSASPLVQVAALRALGETGAPEAATWIEPLLKTQASAAGEELLLYAALRAAGKLHAPLLIPALLRVASKSADPVLAEEALGALGEYCAAETDLRKQVAQKTMDLCAALERKRATWQRLRAPGLRALQRLMGRRMNSVEQFADWWKAYRGEKDPFSGASG